MFRPRGSGGNKMHLLLLSALLLGVLAFAAVAQRKLLLGMLDAATTTTAAAATNKANFTAITADGAVTIAMQGSSSGETEEDSNLLVYIGYLSAPDNRKKRDSLRKLCFPQIRNACLGPNATNANISAGGWGPHCDLHFFIGQPNDPGQAAIRARGHAQGALATAVEIEAAERLQNESDKFGDVQMIPMRDTYNDLPGKTLSIVQHGARSGARAVLKIDDDQCPDMSKVLQIARTTPSNVARYVGKYLWKGTEYKIMQGADGSITPYMSGPAYLLSAALAKAVAIDDINHSVLFMKYGSSSEDVDMGKWFEYAKTTHPELEFKRETVYGLAIDHPPKNTAGRTSIVRSSTPRKKTLGPMVQNIKDGTCWEAMADHTIVVAECDASKPDQNFTLNDEGRILVGSLPGHCFDIRTNSMSPCVDANDGNALQQAFRYDPSTGRIRGWGVCVDYNVEEGKIAQWACHREANQEFHTYAKPGA